MDFIQAISGCLSELLGVLKCPVYQDAKLPWLRTETHFIDLRCSLKRQYASLTGSKTLLIRFSFLVFGLLTLSACETMEEFYDEVIVASVKETISEPVYNAELSYCAGCDWIV